ncbi:MAG TPA: MarP family serine protease [Solirubrobacteraceae bacterium]|jgi:S1-C subfamily serine protease|nr:MarP family serine protease [Solirubrobacteraceae bacterium]
MTWLDWIIVAFVALMALQGFRQGFIVGLLSFSGFALGALIGTRVGPLLLSQGSRSPYAPAFGLFGALLAGGILAVGLEGVGWRLRRFTLAIPGLPVADGLLGAVLSAAIGLGIVWIGAAVAAQAPGDTSLRIDIQRSAILRALNELLPPTGSLLNALSRLDPIPDVAGTVPSVAAPTPAIASAPRVHAAAASVVRVLGSACGLGIEGSGWVVRPGWVLTNAHVVAGESDTTVEVGGHPPNLAAHAIAFDPRNDLAVLSVPGLHAPVLPLDADPRSGVAGAVLGYPEDGPYRVRAARTGTTTTVLTQDAYGNGEVQRLITPLRGVVQPGNSGGPMVSAGGRVLTTVFASLSGGGPPAGYGVANSVVAQEVAHAGRPVSTGPCAE